MTTILLDPDRRRTREPSDLWLQSDLLNPRLHPSNFKHFPSQEDLDISLLKALYPDKDEQWISREVRRRKKRDQQKLFRQNRIATLRILGLPKISAEKKPMEGLRAIADHVGLSLDQIKKRSKELQSAGILRRELKGRPPHRKWVIRGFGSEVKTYLDMLPKPRKK